MKMLSEELNHSLIVALAGLRALDVKAAEALPAKIERAEKELRAINKQLDKANAELEAAEAELAKLQANNKKQYATEVDETRAQLEQAWIDQERANHRLGDLDAAIRDKRALHDGLLAAIATLLTRLDGKPEEEIIARLSSGIMHD
jgi:septal ring factor EnvC (AmiA/AmiB activator)